MAEDRLRRRVRILVTAASVLTVIGFGPILAALASAATTAALGCRVNEASAQQCIVLGTDISNLLYTGFMMGWLFFLTIPLALVALVLWVIAAASWVGGRRRKRGTSGGHGAEAPAAPKQSGLLELDVHARRDLPYYPGAPTGYSGFTDHTAMNCAVNDGLIGRAPPSQFDMTGFGVGLLDGLMQRLSDRREDLPAVLHFETASDLQSEYIGWLAMMQEQGADNAAPSTSNLHGALHGLALDICKDGPVTERFWDRAKSAPQLEVRTDVEARNMQLFLTIFERGRRLGLELGQSARIEDAQA
ncbi:hypothetical protein V474_01875 [Novosphingobium barchaimii LL02]|uniref:Uncharacterized protein n=1 Tax=Novosphingobium barchaimii LL02 TaxID=1114963 RepID=A0A0J8A915_9SPHN|nr:hypothetical protein V474_01875 [Novosphingobium barchaimii LL02]